MDGILRTICDGCLKPVTEAQVDLVEVTYMDGESELLILDSQCASEYNTAPMVAWIVYLEAV